MGDGADGGVEGGGALVLVLLMGDGADGGVEGGGALVLI